MKKFNIIFSLLIGLMFSLSSCEEERLELGEMPDKSEIAYEVFQDLSIDEGGNTVILRNETPGTVAIWDYGTGRSNRMTDTVRFAFQGTYEIKFSALTAGGVVELEPVTIEVTEDNLNYVNDPLWNALSGGVGNEKAWILDIDAKFFDGPMYFYGTNNGWQGECLVEGGDCWNWNPAYADNTWLMPYGDYGVMTFSLKGGPYFQATKPMEGGIEEEGTYFLDINSKMLTINDASILRGYKGENAGVAGISNWSDYIIFSLDENTMQLAVLRDKDIDGEGPVLLVYNFVSKEYSDNYVPEEEEPAGPDEGFNPVFEEGELLQMLAGGPSQGRVWQLDVAGNAVDWLAGGIGWTTATGDSRDWGWNDTWDAAVADSWIRFDRFGGTQNYTRYQGGVETSGTFEINIETNEITLSDGNTLLQNSGSWMSPTTSTITVVKAFPDEFETRGIWFGTSYDSAKDEWLAFHYVIP